MADAPAAPAAPAPTAPAPAQPAAPAQGATVTPIKPPHHSAQQSRAEDGKFTPPPAAPRRIKVEEGVEMEEGELLADYKGRMVDHEAYNRLLREHQEARAKLDAFKDPLKALTPEQQDAIARARLQEFLERQEEAKLPPEEQQRRAQYRALEADRERLMAELEKRTQTEQQAQQQANREHTVSMYRATMGLLGAPDDKNGVVAQQVMAFMYEAKRDGKEYPPETIAHRVRQRMQNASASWVAVGGARGLLTNPKVVELLNGLKVDEHGALLDALGPFMETARAYNLQRRGLTAAPVGGAATPVVVGAQGGQVVDLPVGREPRTNPEWIAWFRAGNKPTTPAQFQAQHRLRSIDQL